MFASFYAKLIGGVVVLALIAGGLLYVHHSGASSERAKLEPQITALQNAQADNLATISKLQAANKALVDKYESGLQAARDAAKAAMQHADEAQRKLANLYATNPKAKRWSNERVPAGVADSLRSAKAHHPH